MEYHVAVLVEKIEKMVYSMPTNVWFVSNTCFVSKVV